MGDYRRSRNLPAGNYEYSFLRTIGEVIEAYNSHVEGDDVNLGEELADVIIFALDVVEQKGIDIESRLLEKEKKILNRQYEVRNGYVVKK